MLITTPRRCPCFFWSLQFQDTSALQFDLLQLLTSEGAVLTGCCFLLFSYPLPPSVRCRSPRRLTCFCPLSFLLPSLPSGRRCECAIHATLVTPPPLVSFIPFSLPPFLLFSCSHAWRSTFFFLFFAQDDQAIYSFRGTNAQIFDRFKRTFEGLVEKNLSTNCL